MNIYLYESMKKHNGKTCTYSSQKRNFFIKHVLNISCMLGSVLGQRFKDEYNMILPSKEFSHLENRSGLQITRHKRAEIFDKVIRI